MTHDAPHERPPSPALEGLTDAQAAAGKNYVDVMRDNLAVLRAALDCR